MTKKKLSKYEEEMIKDAERIEAEIEKDPKIRDMKAPLIARERLFKAIQKMEAAEQKRLTDEEEELIELGKTYKKRKKIMNGLVVVTAATLVMTMGITSVGGVGKIFETFKIMTMGREQIQINSVGSVEKETDWSEDKAYEEVEEKYGFTPVRMFYLPEGIRFQEMILGDQIQGISLVYGDGEKVKISYFIRPNYREGSLGIDVEDELIDSYFMESEDTVIEINQYYVAETDSIKWKAEFSYQKVKYVIVVYDTEKLEFEKIIEGLYFI